MWIYVDNDNRVQGYNPNNMNGNTGWVETASDVPNVLFDDRDIAMYRYDTAKDAIIQRTQEEMEADYEEPTSTPGDSERIDALEQQIAALMGGVMDVQ